MFSGRKDQIYKVLDVIFQTGQHAIIFGDRGVGKTSLANILSGVMETFGKKKLDPLCVRINCDKEDSFKSVWVKIFGELSWTVKKTWNWLSS